MKPGSRRSSRRALHVIIALTLAPLVTISCSAPLPSAAPPDEALSGAVEGDPTPEPINIADYSNDDSDHATHPLREALAPYGGVALNSQAENDQLLDELVGRCITDAGLEWQTPEVASVASGPVDQFGLGISTTAFAQGQVGEGLIGASPDDDSPQHKTDVQDFESLSTGDADRFLQANAECRQWARDAFFTAADGAWPQFVEAFGPQLVPVWDAARADERLSRFDQDLAACMAGHGEPVLPEGEASPFAQEIAELKLDVYREVDRLPDETAEQRSEAAQARANLVLTAEQNRRLADLQSREIAYAVALNSCGADGGTRALLARAIRAEYEHRFVTEHRDEIDSFVASLDLPHLAVATDGTD